MDNFEELRKKVETYPNSSLFVPLAEEYKKRGELDEAIDVLRKGIERQPSYTSARVALAKVFIAKGMKAEAVEELEKVVAVSPDNYFAHKKLAEIYCQMGQKDMAVDRYNAVLGLNPDDEEAVEALKRMEGSGQCEAEETSADRDVASELESLSMPPGEAEDEADFGQEGTMHMRSPFDTAEEDDAEAFDSEAFVQQADPFEEPEGLSPDKPLSEGSSGDEESWDVEDSSLEMGGIEFEPDGVYGDEEAGEVSSREEEAGLDISTGAFSAAVSSQEETIQRESFPDEGMDEGPENESDKGYDDRNILAAAEKVGYDILNEPLGRGSLVPSGGEDEPLSSEYSGEPLVGNYNDEDVLIQAAPGLETFEEEDGEPEEVPEEDKTVLMREPLAGMEESIAEDADEYMEASGVADEDSTVVMEAPGWSVDNESEQEAVAEVVDPGDDSTVVMQAPVWEMQDDPVAQEEVEAEQVMEAYGQDENEVEVVYGSEPFASFDDTSALEPTTKSDAITAEAGTIADVSAPDDSHLINDPFSAMPASSDEIPEPVEPEVLEPEVFEAEVLEPEGLEAASPAPEKGAEMERAERSIAAGEYKEAMRIYSELISMDPEDKITRMKMDELRMLLKVTGQGPMLYQKQLESFVSAIMRRRDELHKST